MQVAKLTASGAPTAIKSDEENYSLGTLIHQAIGEGSVLSFSMAGGNPVQWVQLFNSLEQPDLLGLPLFAPMKMQLQKCEKCSKDFCSLINYRRHIRMHRRQSRSLIVDKESHKNIDLLGAFWDSLSLEDAKNIVSIDDVSLREVSGSSVVEALASTVRKPGVWTMPRPYVMAGSVLLAKNTRLPISSQELFNILDYASERTFLCAGTAESVQKFIIDGEGEEALGMRNLVASASLLFEQKLVRAWNASKDAEALRCQKLLEEEEEAAEKWRSQLLKRRMQKQLRQQERKAREQLNRERIDNNGGSANKCTDPVDGPAVAEFSVSQVSIENNQVSVQSVDSSVEVEMENGHPQVLIGGWQVPKYRSQRSGRNCFYGSQKNSQAFDLESSQKQGLLKDRSEVNNGRIRTRKSKVETYDESSGIVEQKLETNNIDKSNSKLLIGSISVPVSTSTEKHVTRGAANTCSMGSATSKGDKFPEENLKSNSAQEGIDQAATKLISLCLAKSSVLPDQGDNQDTVEIVTSGKVEDNGDVSREICLQSTPNTDKCGKISRLERTDQLQGVLFSIDSARAFLAQRWNEVIAADHVKLVLSPEAPGNPDEQNDSSLVGVPLTEIPKHRVLGDA